MEGLSVGRIVHYVMDDGYAKGAHRPAIVVQVWSQDTGCSNLQVFTDGTNDGSQHASGIAWKTSRVFDEQGAPGTWHWPERA